MPRPRGASRVAAFFSLAAFFSDWAHVLDVALVQAVALLGPRELCAAAAACGAWAETITASEAWLWSIVGNVGAGIDPEIFARLQTWAGAMDVVLRNALQLWFCRAHLWGASAWRLSSGPLREPVATIACLPLPCASARVCCGAWPGGGGHSAGAAVGTAEGVLNFLRLCVSDAPTWGLRGQAVQGMEVVASVRSAHGQHHITAVQPLGPTGARAISSGLDGLLRLWDCSTGEELVQIRTDHARGINSVAVCPTDASRALSCGDDGLVLTYDVERASREGHAVGNAAEPLQRLEAHGAAAYCAAWTCGDCFATGGFDRRALLWDRRASTAAPVAVMPARHHVYALAPLAGSLGGVGAAEGGGAGALAVAVSDGTISHWDLRALSRAPLRELRGHSGAVESLATLPGDVLASASVDGTLRLWDAGRGGEPSWMWSGGLGPLTSVSAALEDALLVVGVRGEPTLLALDYGAAAGCVPEALARLQLPGLRPWTRRLGASGSVVAPPEGHGRHSDLLRTQRTEVSCATPPLSIGFTALAPW